MVLPNPVALLFPTLFLLCPAFAGERIVLVADPAFALAAMIRKAREKPLCVIRWKPGDEMPVWTVAEWHAKGDITDPAGRNKGAWDFKYEDDYKTFVVHGKEAGADLIMGVNAINGYGGLVTSKIETGPDGAAGDRPRQRTDSSLHSLHSDQRAVEGAATPGLRTSGKRRSRGRTRGLLWHVTGIDLRLRRFHPPGRHGDLDTQAQSENAGDSPSLARSRGLVGKRAPRPSVRQAGKWTDHSKAAWDGFARWTEKEYGSDKALAAAWGRPMTFDTVAVPTVELRSALGDVFVDPSTGDGRYVLDWREFFSASIAATVQDMFAHVKHETDGNALTVTFFGYVMASSFLRERAVTFGHWNMHDVFK